LRLANATQSPYPTPFFTQQPLSPPTLNMHGRFGLDANAPSPFLGGHSRIGSVVGGLHSPHPSSQLPHPHGHISPPRLGSYDMNMAPYSVSHVGSPAVMPLSPDGRALSSMLGDLRVS